MPLPTVMQGRPFGPTQLAQIQALLDEHPTASRFGLSRRLTTLWNWRTSNGQLKDMAARTLLLKLQEQGWILLPARRRASPTRSGRAVSRAGARALDETPLAGTLPSVSQLLIEEVSQLKDRERRVPLEACLVFPADHALGLQENSTASPLVQEMCALLVSKMPCEQAEPLTERLTGIKIRGAKPRRPGKKTPSSAAGIGSARPPVSAWTSGSARANDAPSSPSAATSPPARASSP